MNIVLMHFHLNPGGVTTVIRQQAALLLEAGHEVLLIAGEAPQSNMPAPVHVVPGLAYGNNAGNPKAAERIAGEIFDKIKPSSPNLIHVHNPTLAKNRNLQMVLKALQQRGLPLLCQVHDFAEDGRPDHFFQEPYVADCHYATVNGRDRQLLLLAGLQPEGVHYLPNAVAPLPVGRPSALPDPAPVLYPVRAIRRKNIAEAILLHMLCGHHAALYITLPPTSRRDQPGYRLWRHFTERHHLAVKFEAGLKHEFADLVAGCSYVLTTSITEGFGFSFLDSWLAGKVLWGRRLSDICSDFTDKGVRLDYLYDRIQVPLELLDVHKLRQRHEAALADACRKYGRKLTSAALDDHWHQVCREGGIDFGMLDESFQHQLLEALMHNQQKREQLLSVNPFLVSVNPRQDSAACIEINARQISRGFNLSDYGHNLAGIYDRVCRHPVRQSIDKSVLCDHFLAPDRFSLLKWGYFDG